MPLRNLYTLAFGACLLLSLFSCDTAQDNHPRERIDFTQNWAFHLGDVDNAYDPDFVDTEWRKLNLPHDWSIEGEFSQDNPAGVGGGALPGGIGWYRKTFTLSEEDTAKLFFIDFDGVYHRSEVWINGHYLGKRPNGYISFRYALTPYLNYGNQPNTIAVKVNNADQPNSRWYSGSGIYRNVWLVKTHPVHVNHWGTFVTTPSVTEETAQVMVSTQVSNKSKAQGSFSLQTIIYDANDKEVASTTRDITLKDTINEFSQQLTLQDPQLWSVENPYLYKVVTLIKQDGKTVDNYETPLGVRTFYFDAEKGFFLNGKSMKIKGVCLHHDLGALGAAFNIRAQERQLEIMKSMGVNGIRTAHNPPAPELLELCDRMGFIVMNEAYDMWKKGKNEHDYSQDWDDWHKRDLEDLVLRDRNHPSVFMWSIGNEILEQFDSTGTAIATELAAIVRSLDTTRAITSGLNHPETSNYIYQAGVLDLIGYNYHHDKFEDFPHKFPGQKFIGAETTSALATRGEYDIPSDSIRRWPIRWDLPFTEGNDDLTVSAYDKVSTPWGSTHEETWKVVKKHDYLSDMYVWTGFDYIGEPTPYSWPAKSSYFGVVDLAGFPKDTYYMYKSEWTEDTVLHIFPHWNWEEGETIDVWAYYNHADEVELFLNGTSLGTKKKEGDVLHVMWRVTYAPGEVKAVSRLKGEEVATKVIKTAGAPAKIILEADREAIKADGKDLSFITVKIVDKEGNLVPKADNLVHFTVEGEAFIAGVDNGNPTSLESFKGNQRKAFNGLALAILQAKATTGEVKFTATSEGLEPDELTIVLLRPVIP